MCYTSVDGIVATCDCIYTVSQYFISVKNVVHASLMLFRSVLDFVIKSWKVMEYKVKTSQGFGATSYRNVNHVFGVKFPAIRK